MDPNKVGPKGTRVRCAKCKHVFTVSPVLDTPPVAAELVPEPAKTETKPPTSTPSEAPALPPDEDIFANIHQQSSKDEAPATPAPDPLGSLQDIFATLDSNASAPKQAKDLPSELPSRASQRSGTPLPTPLPEAPKIPMGKGFYPVIEKDVPLPQHLARWGILISILLVGALSGLAASGIRSVDAAKLHLRFGRADFKAGPTILTVSKQAIPLDSGNELLRVVGKIYLHSERPSESPVLHLEVFSKTGERIAESRSPCCSSPLKPFAIQSFATEIEIPAKSMADFKVTLEPPDVRPKPSS